MLPNWSHDKPDDNSAPADPAMAVAARPTSGCGNRLPTGDPIHVFPQSPVDVALLAAPSGSPFLEPGHDSASSRRVICCLIGR